MDRIKKIIISIFPFLPKVIDNIKIKKEFKRDANFFTRHYSRSLKSTIKKVGYNILLTSHSLEKGMSNKKIRRFGIQKINLMIDMLECYEKFPEFKNDNFEYLVGVNCLRAYVKCYEENGLKGVDEYDKVVEFLSSRKAVNKINVGSQVLKKKDLERGKKVNYKDFLMSRKSIRNFKKDPVKSADIEKAVAMAALSPSACNRQMCKTYYIKSNKNAKKVIKIAQGLGGFEIDTVNLLIVTFDVSASWMGGERTQGMFNAGLYSMNLVNALHSIGIGSCFCQFGNFFKEEVDLKKELNIPENERIAVIITCGYYPDEVKIPMSPRKSLKETYEER